MTHLLNNKFFVLFLAPFLLGSLVVFSLPPFSFTLVNFFSFSFLLFFISLVKKKTESKYRKKKTKRYYFYLGCAFGFGFFLFGNYWITISLTHDEIFTVLIPLALILIPLFLSLFFGFATLLIGPFVQKNIYFILLFSLVFAIFEFLRGNLLTGFPWNLIAYSWSWSTESIQILSLIGSYSFSMISITFFCVPFLFFKKNFNKNNLILILFFFIIFVGNYFYGFQKINKNSFNFHEDINVKIISPSFSLKDYNTRSEISQLKRLIKISNPEKNKKTLFIWPEGIFYESYLSEIKEKYKDLFSKNFSKNHLIVLGINHFKESENKKNFKYFNSLVVVNNHLEIVSIYNKINLVPFGEFLPFENFFSKFGLKKVTSGYNSFSAGDTRQLIGLGSAFKDSSVLPLVCYEIIYPGKIKTKNQRSNLIINISEDAWFGSSIGPHQHYAKAIYRAVEEGVFIARSANKGISGFINPRGKSIKFLNISESGSVMLKMPQFTNSTLFSNYGNKIFFLTILVYIFLIFIFKRNEI